MAKTPSINPKDKELEIQSLDTKTLSERLKELDERFAEKHREYENGELSIKELGLAMLDCNREQSPIKAELERRKLAEHQRRLEEENRKRIEYERSQARAREALSKESWAGMTYPKSKIKCSNCVHWEQKSIIWDEGTYGEGRCTNLDRKPIMHLCFVPKPRIEKPFWVYPLAVVLSIFMGAFSGAFLWFMVWWIAGMGWSPNILIVPVWVSLAPAVVGAIAGAVAGVMIALKLGDKDKKFWAAIKKVFDELAKGR